MWTVSLVGWKILRQTVTYEAKKKGENLLRNLHRRKKKIVFFIYEVFVKQKKRKRSAYHYFSLCTRFLFLVHVMC